VARVAVAVTRTGRWAAGTMIALAVLAACSGGAAAKKHAAEPAVAPTPSARPAGTVVAVGDNPQGIVYDPRTGLVAVAVRDPDRLVLIDGATMKIVRSVPLAGHARHLQLAGPGGPVLVPEEDADVLGLVSLPSGAVRQLKTGSSPHDAAAVTGGYAIGDEFGRSLTIARTGAPEQTVRDVVQPGGIVGYGAQFAVVDVGAYTVSTYRTADGRRIARRPAGKGPTHGVRAADGQLVVVDTRGDELLRFTESPLRQTATKRLPGSPYGIAADPTTDDLVWITLTGRNQVVGLRVTGRSITEVTRLDTVAQPDTVAVEPGSHTLFVTGSRTGVVQRLER
jgi:hypothetical protein